MPSLAFLTATPKPIDLAWSAPVWRSADQRVVFLRCLIREPEDRRSREVCKSAGKKPPRFYAGAFREATFVFTVRAMMYYLVDLIMFAALATRGPALQAPSEFAFSYCIGVTGQEL